MLLIEFRRQQFASASAAVGCCSPLELFDFFGYKFAMGYMCLPRPVEATVAGCAGRRQRQ